MDKSNTYVFKFIANSTGYGTVEASSEEEAIKKVMFGEYKSIVSCDIKVIREAEIIGKDE